MTKRRIPQLPKPLKRADENPDRESLPTPGDEARSLHVQRLVADGARLLAAKRPGEAAAVLARAWEMDASNAAAAINLGGAYILQGKHERAIPVLEAASRLEPDNPMVWTNLAAAYLGKLPFATPERQDRAITAFERALALDPHTPHVHYNLGLIYVERDDLTNALRCFTDALITDPNDRDARSWQDKIRRGEEPTAELRG